MCVLFKDSHLCFHAVYGHFFERHHHYLTAMILQQWPERPTLSPGFWPPLQSWDLIPSVGVPDQVGHFAAPQDQMSGHHVATIFETRGLVESFGV